MSIKPQSKLLPAILAALAMTAGSALAAAPEKDPGQKQPTSAQPSSSMQQSTMQQSTPSATTAAISPAAYEKFDAIDVDHDGSIDRKEAEASKTLSTQFSKLDSNKDGKLSVTEFNNANNMAAIKVDKKPQGY
ncbi:MAG TPA: EF-hand domain-containing protein [Rudaea sp.]|jgi:Ca2+-binding EF-hand superfamily protein